MAFSGLAFNEAFTKSLVQEDVAAAVAALAPKETPLLDFLGDSDRVAFNVKHEYVLNYQLPNYLIASTLIASATAAGALHINGLGLALGVGQLIENESATPELMQITSVLGANTIWVTRAYDGGTPGSLVAGGSLYVRERAGVEGADHSGADTRRLGDRVANTVGLFSMELAQSNTQSAINMHGNDSWDARRGKGLVDVLHQLEKAVIRGKLNAANSLATSSTTRTLRGIKDHITTVNSAIAASSFAANPHLYIGNVWQQIWNNGASDSESWAVIAGATFFRNLADMNDTKVQDSNTSELFQRAVRLYRGPFGQAQLILNRVLGATELLLVPRERIKIVPLQGRSFSIADMAVSGDNRKALLTGEYTIEVHHEPGMARLYV